MSDPVKRQYHILEREDGSVSFYYTLHDDVTHYVLWDSLHLVDATPPLSIPQLSSCEWKDAGSEFENVWETSCKQAFVLEEGTPKDNDMVFCCYCGRKINDG